jgi:molecular chaperone GrpE
LSSEKNQEDASQAGQPEGAPSEEKKQTETERKLQELLNQEKKRNDELVNRMKYLQADFENYQKRAERETQQVGERAVLGLVTRLLSVLDELELASANAAKPGQGKAVSEGIKMVYRNLSSVMKTAGLRRIEAVGMPFDPGLHEAVEKVDGSGDTDRVVEEIRSGYMFRGQVLRPSMVKVELAMKKASEPEANANE